VKIIRHKKYFYYKVGLLSTVALTLLVTFIYGYFIEPNTISIERVTIKDPKFSKVLGDLKIVHLSDLHISEMGQREEAVLQAIEQLKPDMILVTGDIAQWQVWPENAIKFIEQLKAPCGVFFVLGDADMSSGRGHCFFCHPHGNYHRLRNHPFFLRNETIKMKRPGGTFFLGGISPDLESDEEAASIIEQFLKDAQGAPLILLSHFPRIWKFVPIKNHVLVLSGDTHGGQIWLPVFLWKLAGYKQVTDETGIEGLFSKGNGAFLYINPGIGTTRRFPFRIGVPPRIVIFEFRP